MGCETASCSDGIPWVLKVRLYGYRTWRVEGEGIMEVFAWTSEMKCARSGRVGVVDGMSDESLADGYERFVGLVWEGGG